LDETLGVSVQNLVKSATDYRDLASECDRRRAVCADFDRALAAYERLHNDWMSTPVADRGSRPNPPNAPFAWVERS